MNQMGNSSQIGMKWYEHEKQAKPNIYIYKFMTRARDPMPSPREETLHFHHLHCRYCATVPHRLHIRLCKGHWRQQALHSSGRLCCGEVAPGHHDTIDMITTSLPMFPGDDLKSHGFVYQVKVISNIEHSSKIGKKNTVNDLSLDTSTGCVFLFIAGAGFTLVFIVCNFLASSPFVYLRIYT